MSPTDITRRCRCGARDQVLAFRAMNPLVIAMVAAAAMPTAGTKAPAFSLESTSGKKVSLDDYKGKTLVLAFFPKAFTGG